MSPCSPRDSQESSPTPQFGTGGLFRRWSQEMQVRKSAKHERIEKENHSWVGYCCGQLRLSLTEDTLRNHVDHVLEFSHRTESWTLTTSHPPVAERNPWTFTPSPLGLPLPLAEWIPSGGKNPQSENPLACGHLGGQLGTVTTAGEARWWWGEASVASVEHFNRKGFKTRN